MLEVIGLENQAKWIDTVRQFQKHDVYHLPQYVKAFKLHGDGEPMLLYYEANGTRAINVVMKRDIARCGYFTDAIEKNTYFDLATPYGYGGFLVEGDRDAAAMQALNARYCAWCLDHGVVSEFVRFHPVLENHLGMAPIYEITEPGKTVSMDLSSPEVIRSNMKANKRTRINKALKNGAEVFRGLDAPLMEAFRQIYDETMDRTDAQPYYYFENGFYDSIMVDLKDNALVFYCRLAGEIIAATIILFCNGQMHSHLSGTRNAHLSFSPITLLTYTAALWGHENGYKTLHLGGGVGGREDNLYVFKSEFNKNSHHTFAIGKKIFDNDAYEFLQGIRRKNEVGMNPGFFPQYRA